MRITAFLTFCFCIAILLPGCSSFWGAQVETTATSEIDWAALAQEATGEHTDPRSYPPLLRWTRPVSMKIYGRLAIAIERETTPDFKGFTEEQISEAYNAIFYYPEIHISDVCRGWFETFAMIVNYVSNGRTRISYGYSNDPLFEQYRDKRWRVPFVLIRVDKYHDPFDRNLKKVFGLVITPPEPKTTEPEAQAE